MSDSKKIILAGVTVNDDTFDLYTAEKDQNGNPTLFGTFPLEKAQRSVLKRLGRHDFSVEPLEMRVRYFNSDPDRVSEMECPFGMFYTGIGSFLPNEYDEAFFEAQRLQWQFNDFKERRAHLERRRIEKRWENDEEMRHAYGRLEAYYDEMANAEKHFLEELPLPLRNAASRGGERPVLVCTEAWELAERIVRREKKNGRWGMSDQKNEKQFDAVIGRALEKECAHMKDGTFRFVCDYDFTPAMQDDIHLIALNYARLTELGRSHVPEYMCARFENREICSVTQNAEAYRMPVEPAAEKETSAAAAPIRPKTVAEGKETPSWQQGRPLNIPKTVGRIASGDRRNTPRGGLKPVRTGYLKIKSSHYR